MRSGLIAIVIAGMPCGTTGVVVQMIRQSADISDRKALYRAALELQLVRRDRGGRSAPWT